MTKGDGEDAVRSLIRFVSRGEYGLKEVPPLIKEVIREGYWREREEPFTRFVDFVEHPPTAGLGADIPTIKRLCGDDVEALDLIDKATENPTGVHIINTTEGRPEGTSAQQALRKLRKDRPDLHARVLAGEVSPHGAMVEAGFRPKTATVPLAVPDLARAIRRHLTTEQTTELVRLLSQEVG
jgi:hypothetical protein